jgi:hypothetical protein
MIGTKKIFTGVTKKQCIEFGQTAILVTLFLALYLKQNNFVIAAFICTLITVLAPIIFYPFAFCWLGISKILSFISSRIIVSLIFFLVVTPVGLVRQLSGKDSLKMKQFKKNRKSVMEERNHLYTDADFIHTF